MRLNLSTYGGTLADPENVRMMAPQFEPRKKVPNLCVRLQASEQIKLQTVGLYCGGLGHSFGISFSGKGGIRLRQRKTYYLDQMDLSVRPS